MFSAITETFSELWNMKDPNAGPNPFRVSQPKKKQAISKYLGMGMYNQNAKIKPNAKITLPPAKSAFKTQPNAPKAPIRTPLQKAVVGKESKQLNKRDEPFITNHIKDKGTWNTVLPEETPELAADRLQQRLASKKQTRKTTHIVQSGPKKQFNFLNISDQSILEYVAGQQPKWANLFPQNLSVEKNRAYFDGLPILLKDERRQIVKKTYFDPALPISIYAIHDHLRKVYANITRRNVTSTLRTLETYQRLSTRQLPHKITGRVEVYSPGFLAADTVYPSRKNGWGPNTIILTVVDMWSRYSGAYLLSDKRKNTVAKAFQLYIDSFMKLTDSRPRKLMLDKGSELKGLDEIMERYSAKRPCVFRSLTGQPVNIIEGLNAQVQRMAQVYNEAGIVSSYDDVLYLVMNAINHQSRPDRMGYNPTELMQMNAGMRQDVNSNYKFRNLMSAEKNPLSLGSVVRILMLNRKEQVDAKTKGFPANWSTDVFMVTNRRAVIKNPGVFKYFCKSMSTGEKIQGSRFRHELLELKGVKTLADIDQNVPRVPLKKVRRDLYRVEGSGERALYDPADDWDALSD
jgi:hypothetical protein